MFNGELNSQSGNQMHYTNSLSPERMTQDQRLLEVANIMAEGLMRLRMPAQKLPTDSDSDSDISLAMPAYRSVHANAESTNKSEAE